jgi:hypothetical protein
MSSSIKITKENTSANKRYLIIETCNSCPYMNVDDGYDERKWGKVWCDKLDRELKTIDIPDDCPLPIV